MYWALILFCIAAKHFAKYVHINQGARNITISPNQYMYIYIYVYIIHIIYYGTNYVLSCQVKKCWVQETLWHKTVRVKREQRNDNNGRKPLKSNWKICEFVVLFTPINFLVQWDAYHDAWGMLSCMTCHNLMIYTNHNPEGCFTKDCLLNSKISEKLSSYWNHNGVVGWSLYFFHMPRQLSCRGMSKNLQWSNGHKLNHSKALILLDLNFEWKNQKWNYLETTGKWTTSLALYIMMMCMSSVLK